MLYATNLFLFSFYKMWVVWLSETKTNYLSFTPKNTFMTWKASSFHTEGGPVAAKHPIRVQRQSIQEISDNLNLNDLPLEKVNWIFPQDTCQT